MPYPNKIANLSQFKAHQTGSRPWFSVRAAQKDQPPEVFIYDEIGRGFFGGGVAPEDLIKEIKALDLKSKDELMVRINSPGGDFFDGNTIYNYLRSIKPKVIVRVDGIAASAASIIAMAGNRIEMPENAFLFIHNPFAFAIGDANVMRKAADDLDKMRDNAVSTYLRRTGDKVNREDMVSMLDAATWLTAEEAVTKGFADIVDEPVRAAALAQFNLDAYGFQVPQQLVAARENDLAERRSLLQNLRDAGDASTAGANATRNIAKNSQTNSGVRHEDPNRNAGRTGGSG
jgi:ATP-dependent protease ClpP protease subunit